MVQSFFLYQRLATSPFPFPDAAPVNLDEWFVQELYQRPTFRPQPYLYPIGGDEPVIFDVLTPLKGLTLKLDDDISTILSLHGKVLPITTIKNAPMGRPPGGVGALIQRFDHNVRIFVWDNDSSTWIGLAIPDVSVVNTILTTGLDGQILVKDSLVPFGLKWADTGSFFHDVDLDFGATGVRSKTFVISDPDVRVGIHHITALHSADISDSRPQDENEMDAIIYRATPGPLDGQITIYADSLFGPVSGKYNLHYMATIKHHV